MSDRDEAAAEFQAAAVVFEGEVLPGGHQITSWNGRPSLIVIPFRVTKSYKGASEEEVIELHDASAGTDCGFEEPPKSGTKFFVYGFREGDGKVYIRACTRTTLLDNAGPDVRFAHNELPTKEDLTLPGEKWRLHRDPTLKRRGASINGVVRRADGSDPRGVFITIWDLDKNGARSSIGLVEATQQVNADGSFQIRFLPPGKYDVTAEDRRITEKWCQADYGNVVLGERQVLSHLRLTCKAVRAPAP